MDRSAKERIPGVLALLMGLLGMTAMTVTCYLTGEEPLNPSAIAIKAGIAYLIMLVVGFIVGTIARAFIPEPPAVKKAAPAAQPKDEAAQEEDRKAVGEGSIDEHTLNLLLNETPGELTGGGGAASGANAVTIKAPTK